MDHTEFARCQLLNGLTCPSCARISTNALLWHGWAMANLILQTLQPRSAITKFPACDFRPEKGVIAPVPRIMRLFWGREKGTLLISTVREGKEPRGHARKRLMQAANGLIGLSRRFQRFRRRCEDLFPFVFFECFVVNSLLQSPSVVRAWRPEMRDRSQSKNGCNPLGIRGLEDSGFDFARANGLDPQANLWSPR